MPVDPLTTTVLSGISAWVWEKYGQTVTDKTAGAVKGRWDEFKWKDAAERYRAKIKTLYGTMQIMGMAKPVPLDDIFTDAYMLDKPTAFGRFDIERLKQMSADPDTLPHAERINGLRLVREKGNLFILGKPGAGKTTFLKYIALQAAEQNIDKIPIFVSLKLCADSGLELLRFIAERFDICDFPDAQPFVEELLKSGSATVLFDGLDEVNQESGQRDKKTRAMNNFVEKYDRTQCLITCRLAASDYSFQPFTYVEIADFTEKQIETFVGNWFRNNEGEKDDETCAKFLAEFAKDDNKGLRDLARTPLLLTLLCLAFNETLTFPQRRVEIYEEALDALLKKWDSSRRIKRDEVYRKLSLGHKENMLARIAAETFEKNEYFIPQPELERRITDYVKNVPPHDMNEAIDGEVILKAIEAQHG
ncbi:MAG: NACHT domain-containing protein, partial [Acidobacteriota bacterium]|nr:NACHT domain-containing protein [Acidobacteriota bacterium]